MTKIIGVLNYNDTSFSDGGLFNTLNKGTTHVKYLTKKGADFIDIGCTTTSYGAKLLTADEELEKLQPLLKAIDLTSISIDTCNLGTMKSAIDLGVKMINDVSGGQDPRVLDLLVRHKTVKYICMLSLVLPADRNIRVKSIDEVYEWAIKTKEKCKTHGITEEQLILDPGIGFVTNSAQSFELIRNICKFKQLNIPICVGHSRKSFLASVTKHNINDRDIETMVISLFLKQSKVDYIRVHNVEMHRRAFDIADSLQIRSL